MGLTRRQEKRRNMKKFGRRFKPSDSRSQVNSKQEIPEKMHNQTYHNQTLKAETKRKKKTQKPVILGQQ